jgi:hypothetical protein
MAHSATRIALISYSFGLVIAAAGLLVEARDAPTPAGVKAQAPYGRLHRLDCQIHPVRPDRPMPSLPPMRAARATAVSKTPTLKQASKQGTGFRLPMLTNVTAVPGCNDKEVPRFLHEVDVPDWSPRRWQWPEELHDAG